YNIGLALVVLGIQLVPLHLLAAARLGGVYIARSDVHDDFAEGTHFLGELVSILVLGKIFGHFEHLLVNARKIPGGTLRGSGSLLRLCEQWRARQKHKRRVTC